MRWELPSGRIRRWPIAGRIDRAAKSLNPFLVIVVALLAIIDVSSYWALEISRQHPPRPGASQPVTPPPALGDSAVLASPQD